MRPLVYIAVGYITGIIWGLYLKMSIVPIFFLITGVIFLITKIGGIDLSNFFKYKFCIMCLIIFSIISNFQILRLEKKFNTLYNNITDVKIVGTVISDEKETSYKLSYTIKVESINNNTKYKGTNLIIYISKEQKLTYGSKYCFSGSYSKASNATNYRAFDYKEYLKTKNVYGIFNVEDAKLLKQKDVNFVNLFINNLRTKIKYNLQEILGKNSSIALGILIR